MVNGLHILTFLYVRWNPVRKWRDGEGQVKAKTGKVHLNALVHRKYECVKAFFEKMHWGGGESPLWRGVASPCRLGGLPYVCESFAAHRGIVLRQKIYRLAEGIRAVSECEGSFQSVSADMDMIWFAGNLTALSDLLGEMGLDCGEKRSAVAAFRKSLVTFHIRKNTILFFPVWKSQDFHV